MQGTSDQLLFSYTGTLDSGRTESLVDDWEQRAAHASLPVAASRKLSRILIEVLQNVYKYGCPASGGVPVIDLKCFSSGDTLILSSSNLLESSDMARITAEVNRLQELHPDQITDTYRKMLASGHQNTKGGMGLGLIDMYRKSGHLPVVEFKPAKDTRLWKYTLKLTINMTL